MTVRFSVEYFTRWGERLCLVAGDKSYPMAWGAGNIWSVSIRNCPAALLEDYTYVLMQGDLVARTEWEHHRRGSEEAVCGVGEDGAANGRRATGKGGATVEIRDSWNDCPVPGCPFPRKHSVEMFDRPGFRGAGTAVPVWALRGDDDFGIGEFTDLPGFADWAARTGQCIIQLLPINDTTRCGAWGDSYPYNPVSAFALHPIYVHLPSVGVEPDEEYRRLQAELNALPTVDYPRVAALKDKYLRKAFADRGSKDCASREFREFTVENAEWLDGYAEFRAKREGADGGESAAAAQAKGGGKAGSDRTDATGNPKFYRWTQWHLHKQLSAAAEYLHSKGICLKGDLPIGVGRDSADAAAAPKLFNLDSNAGAPPDFFSAEGQNWGFPTYNWDVMARDGYAWWKRRLRKMAEYFDAFRIDHILGFFRIWEIPQQYKGGRLGHFNPALPYSRQEITDAGLPLDGLFLEDPRRKGWFHPLISPDTSSLEPWQKERFDSMWNDFFFHRHEAFWKYGALRKLPQLLGATGMLACGEDLGMVPSCVNEVMDSQKILSLEMACMDKGREWPRLSVCATSSHDMEGLRLQGGTADKDPLQCREILAGHLNSQSMLAIFPIQDWLSLDGQLRAADPKAERINDPANPDNHWCWRLHLSNRQLLDSPAFCTAVATLIADSGRKA